ncbi:rhodanese homology domain-containing protein [Paenirhodobacter sp.]|uniref:rhodanese homology domain-containing protein n=1 Tax=Paenirhodobacter sp. TaxID=1965326 RepID=UPI003B3D8CA2
MTHAFPTLTPAEVRADLLARREIALIDLREEDPYARGHPLWAANFPLGRLELDLPRRIPRRDVRIVLYGDQAPLAAQRLRGWGYGNVYLLKGGLAAWQAAGYETFIDVNVPSKAFGELVEARRHTPLLPAEEVARRIASDRPPVILDARRFDEYHTMSIPTGISVPGAELLLRLRDLAPDPETPVIVNCAGRTRSIIGTQSLINAGVPNPVAGLRNGTIGWTLAGLDLDHGAERQFGPVSDEARAAARAQARQVAERAGVPRVAADAAVADPGRSLYRIDVRTAEEYAAGHLPGFIHVPGGQLVQETDHTVPVRGARIVLADDDGTRADMTASWLAQMGWEVAVVDPVDPAQRSETQPPAPAPIPAPVVEEVTPTELSRWLAEGTPRTAVIDLTTSANHVREHIPGAWFALRPRLAEALDRIGPADRYVLTCGSSALARYAVPEVQALTSTKVVLLAGGTQAWKAAGLPLASGEDSLAAPRIDRYRRPYEGTDAPRAAMEAYLEWEYGLVAQLDRDGTHFFNVI